MALEIETISLCLQTPGALPPLIWGDFGIGKTSRVTALADALRWDVEILRPAERGEGALGVVPVPSEDRSVLHYPLPAWAARLAASDHGGLVFLDEVSSTPPALQPAIMGLALDGIIAGQKLPPHIKRCAAANPIDQAAGGWELAPALANRFVHLEWASPKAPDWIAWLAGQDSGDKVVKLDMADFEKELGQAKALAAAFLRRFPDALHEDVQKTIGRTPPAFSTPRTWETAVRLLAACRAAGRMELYPALAQGSLGPTVAMQGAHGDAQGAWLVWLKDNDLPDPEDILDNPLLFTHDVRRPDRTFAILFSVAEAALLTTAGGKKLSDKVRVDRWHRGWAVLERGLDMKLGKDLVLLPARQLAAPARRPKAPPGEAGERVCGVLGSFIDLYST